MKMSWIVCAAALSLAVPTTLLAQGKPGAKATKGNVAAKSGGARPEPIRGAVRGPSSTPPLKLDPKGTEAKR
jgi:hypothetical protein